MDKQSSVAFLSEVLDHLNPYGDVYLEKVTSEGCSRLYRQHLSPEGLVSACEGASLEVEFCFYDENGNGHSASRVMPFKTAKHFVTGQGKSFARDMKREVANKLFDLG